MWLFSEVNIAAHQQQPCMWGRLDIFYGITRYLTRFNDLILLTPFVILDMTPSLYK